MRALANERTARAYPGTSAPPRQGGFLAPGGGPGHHRAMVTQDRRLRRGATVTQSLRYQLAACCEEGRIDAMVVADEDGLPLASSGNPYACDEVAARIVLVGPRIREFNGVLFGSGHRWDVQMKKVECQGAELLVCAVGGTAEARQRQIARGAEGAVRILAA